MGDSLFPQNYRYAFALVVRELVYWYIKYELLIVYYIRNMHRVKMIGQQIIGTFTCVLQELHLQLHPLSVTYWRTHLYSYLFTRSNCIINGIQKVLVIFKLRLLLKKEALRALTIPCTYDKKYIYLVALTMRSIGNCIYLVVDGVR